MKPIIFVDTEVSEADNKAYDFGAVSESGEKLHTGSFSEFNSSFQTQSIFADTILLTTTQNT
ncbi:MAG: hypothetical protein ACLTD2_05830 [Ruminococcus sp.]